MDKVQLGMRLAQARELAAMTQESVARAVGLDRSALVLLEKGERNLRVPELVRIAEVLGRPLSFFVDRPVPAVVSRRQAPHTAHRSTGLLDVELAQFAGDARALADMGLLAPAHRPAEARLPRTVVQAESAARRFRRQLGKVNEPLPDLARACELLGLYSFVTGLGESGPDGGCVEVETTKGMAGVALINGEADPGRRRMTLAHELGHWLFGDAYDVNATFETEQRINAFAIHFLAPRAGVRAVWSQHLGWNVRDRALAVSVTFQLSWSAAVSQLRNLELISHDERDQLAATEPRRGEFLRLSLGWVPDLVGPSLSPEFVAACLAGYTTQKLTRARTLELLRGVVAPDELPEVEALALDDLRRSFEGHAFERRG